MDRKKDIEKAIERIAGKYSSYEVFSDWIRCMALAIENGTHLIHDKLWQEREQMYLDTVKRYTHDELVLFAEMMAMLTETMEDGPDDILGKIYMESGMGSKAAGQFFTPYHLSVLCAEVALQEDIEAYKAGKLERITVNEPSCGGGAMIIAAAEELRKAGINYQKAMDVVAQDLDWKGVYMCYVQLSLFGISAICVQGNTLTEPYDPHKTPRSHILTTPKKAGMLI